MNLKFRRVHIFALLSSKSVRVSLPGVFIAGREAKGLTGGMLLLSFFVTASLIVDICVVSMVYFLL